MGETSNDDVVNETEDLADKKVPKNGENQTKSETKSPIKFARKSLVSKSFRRFMKKYSKNKKDDEKGENEYAMTDVATAKEEPENTLKSPEETNLLPKKEDSKETSVEEGETGN